ncbi:hypothetical protein AK812_SmicGene10469 [Symbiodinium microadriaticum]|uniref:ShKT domain-containing protein n=1 Tax=Symbiodinium microadriaticum TaxID=2951 RepID=A0A1Q9EFS6_SYMMI|nr:hypothetical protein AK812_SmicGene10469 [Symbiodinium microadriaticum]
MKTLVAANIVITATLASDIIRSNANRLMPTKFQAFGFGLAWLRRTVHSMAMVLVHSIRAYFRSDWLWPTIETLTGATDCASAKPFCERRDLPLVRMTCPQTCGCVDPLAGLYVDNGCRQLCIETDAFQAALGDAVCQDLAQEEHELAWHRWWAGFYSNERGIWSEVTGDR